MASAGAHLPPWDKGNVEQGGLFHRSKYADILNKACVELRDNLRMDDIWPHLRRMGVMTHHQEDRFKCKANCESVDKVIRFMYTCQIWGYHALLRAMALTNQAHLIPEGGLPREVYMEGTDKATSLSDTSRPYSRAPASSDKPKDMASAGAHLPPWDKGNTDQGGLFHGSKYEDVLNRAHVELRDNLRMDDIWPHLRQMGVMSDNDKERMKCKVNCDSVDQVISFIKRCQTWTYHALLRAMALTHQAHLIPEGGLPREVYMEGTDKDTSRPHSPAPTSSDEQTVPGGSKVRGRQRSTRKCVHDDKRDRHRARRMERKSRKKKKTKKKKHVSSTSSSQESDSSGGGSPQPKPKQHYYRKADSEDMLPISADLLPALLRHCEVSGKYLMRAPLFGFDDDNMIDITQFHVHTDAECTDGRVPKTIGWRDLFCKLFDTERHEPDTLLIQGEAGSGKTTFLEDYSLRHCKEFTECEEKGPEWPCQGHSWKLILCIPAVTVTGSQKTAIRENLHCDNKDKDQVMTMIEENGEGVLVMNDGLDELRKEAEKDSICQYTIDHQKHGRPKVLNSARQGLSGIRERYYDRKVTITGFSLDKGTQCVENYFEGCSDHSDLLACIKQQKTNLEWLLTNPLRVHVFSYLAVKGQLTIEDIKSLTNTKLMKVLESFTLKREGKCREAETTEAHSTQFYRLCLECLFTDERTIAEGRIPDRSPYKAFLDKYKRIDLYANETSYFKFGHEVLFEFFSMRGICQYLKSHPTHKKALLLHLCLNKNMRNVIRLLFGYVAEIEPGLHNELTFIIQACLILQAEIDPEEDVTDSDGSAVDEGQHSASDNSKQKQNKVIKKLAQLPDVIKKTCAATDIVTSGLSEEQLETMSDAAEEIEAAFNDNAEHLRAVGWFLHAGYKLHANKNFLELSDLLQFIIASIRQCSPSLQETICSQTTHKLLPIKSWFEDRNMCVYPTSGVRWGVVRLYTHIYGWCATDVTAALTYCHTELQSSRPHSIHVITQLGHWGLAPPEQMTCSQWLPALHELFNRSIVLTIWTDCATPLDGLLQALQSATIPTDCQLQWVRVVHGQVSEEVLVSLSEWARTVRLEVRLSGITVWLSKECNEDYVKQLHQRVQHVMYSDEFNTPTYMTPTRHTVRY